MKKALFSITCTNCLFYVLSVFGSVQFEALSEVQHASHADYLFVQNAIGQQWIYKQITDTSPDDQMVVVLEILASDIAKVLDFPINHVQLISAEKPFTHRIFHSYPGSLHLKVSGRSTEEMPPWEGFTIHQKFRTPFMMAARGPLDPQEMGLRKEIIQNMARHTDLPKIVALDTYLSNIDRSNSNIFYSEDTNHFYGIDMGSCLMGNLAQCACDKMAFFSLQNITWSKPELQALQEYRSALILLTEHFPPATLFTLLDQYLEASGFCPTNSLLWSEDAERQWIKWQKNIEESYQSSLYLIKLLEETLQNATYT